MNRRWFLSLLCAAPAVAVMPKILTEPPMPNAGSVVQTFVLPRGCKTIQVKMLGGGGGGGGGPQS